MLPFKTVGSSEGVRMGQIVDSMTEHAAILRRPERVLLLNSKIVSGEDEMDALHAKASNEPNKPWTEDDLWSDESDM